MRLSDFQKETENTFRNAGFDSPEIETAYLLEEVTGIRHNLLALHGDRELSPAETANAADYLRRRLANEPFQYICKWTEFRYLTLNVAPGCLIPRPETEVLVDFALKKIPVCGSVCELGTGSGAIALSIGYERPDCQVFASELSPDALAIAEENKVKNKIQNVSFFAGNLLAPFPADKLFHVLVANLPYIPESARDSLPPNVRDYEPGMALFAEDDGMALIKRALKEAPPHLMIGASLFFEMGEEQGAALMDFAGSCGCYTEIAILKDQYGADRFLTCIFRPPHL